MYHLRLSENLKNKLPFCIYYVAWSSCRMWQTICDRKIFSSKTMDANIIVLFAFPLVAPNLIWDERPELKCRPNDWTFPSPNWTLISTKPSQICRKAPRWAPNHTTNPLPKSLMVDPKVPPASKQELSKRNRKNYSKLQPLLRSGNLIFDAAAPPGKLWWHCNLRPLFSASDHILPFDFNIALIIKHD